MNILAIGAHFDDVEIGCGGSLLKFKENGHKIHIIVITDSEYSNFDGSIIRTKEQALCEGTATATMLGISSFVAMGYRCKEVKCEFPLIEGLNYLINRVDPDLIFTHWTGDLHEDHHEVARASLVAARHYPCVLMYRSNWYHSNETFNGRFYIDITNSMDDKANLMRTHKAEYNKRGEPWIDFMKSRAREAGLRMGIQYAEEFEVFKYKMGVDNGN